MSYYTKHYPRTTRNFYYCIEGDLTVWYSYETAIAVEVDGKRYVCENMWSVTTGKHLSWIDGGEREAKHSRVPYLVFRELCKKHAIDETNRTQTSYLTTEDLRRIELLNKTGSAWQ
jgi:hypothetical protein